MINLIDFNKIVKKKQNIIRVSSTDIKIKLKRLSIYKTKLKHILIQIFDS